jgi:ribosomal protein RSM22 (predicted rRNA methylase)
VTAPARFRQADLKRALKAAKDSGYEAVRVKIGAGGEMEIIVGNAANDEEPEELE